MVCVYPGDHLPVSDSENENGTDSGGQAANQSISADCAKEMCAKPWNGLQQVATDPGIWGKPPGQRRGQCDPVQLNPAARKELEDLSLLNSRNVRVSRIIDVIVIPDDEAARFKDPQHFRGELLFRAMIQHRSENCRLQNQVEAAIGKVELAGAPALDCKRARAETPGFGHSVRQQINAGNVFRPGTPLNEFAKPVACSAANLENPFCEQRGATAA
jgi:hypothetical protein